VVDVAVDVGGDGLLVGEIDAGGPRGAARRSEPVDDAADDSGLRNRGRSRTAVDPAYVTIETVSVGCRTPSDSSGSARGGEGEASAFAPVGVAVGGATVDQDAIGVALRRP